MTDIQFLKQTMSSRRRSVLGPINEVPKIDIRQPTKRNTRRASMAVTSSYTTNKPNRRSIHIISGMQIASN